MRLFAFAVVLCLCSAALGDEENWNQFRGPRGDGTTTVTGLPVRFGEGSPDIVWKTPIPGRAWSSPVVHGNLLYLTFDGYDLQYIAALDKLTGKTVWKKDRGIDYKTTDGDAKKAYSTPLLVEVGGRELLVSPFAYATIAYEPKTGEPIWTVFHGG